MKGKGPKYERETILNFNEELRRLLSFQNPSGRQPKRSGRQQGAWDGVVYLKKQSRLH